VRASSKTASNLDTQRVHSLQRGTVPGAAFMFSCPVLVGLGATEHWFPKGAEWQVCSQWWRTHFKWKRKSVSGQSRPGHQRVSVPIQKFTQLWKRWQSSPEPLVSAFKKKSMNISLILA